MNESGKHHSQQTDTRTENQTPHVLTHRLVLNNENTWAQGREHHTLGFVGGWGRDEGRITLGKMPDVGDGGWRQQTTKACVYLCNNPACFAHVPQNLKCNKIYVKIK